MFERLLDEQGPMELRSLNSRQGTACFVRVELGWKEINTVSPSACFLPLISPHPCQSYSCETHVRQKGDDSWRISLQISQPWAAHLTSINPYWPFICEFMANFTSRPDPLIPTQITIQLGLPWRNLFTSAVTSSRSTLRMKIMPYVSLFLSQAPFVNYNTERNVWAQREIRFTSICIHRNYWH